MLSPCSYPSKTLWAVKLPAINRRVSKSYETYSKMYPLLVYEITDAKVFELLHSTVLRSNRKRNQPRQEV